MADKILIIGGTGAQGSAIVRALSTVGKYDIHVLTRDIQSTAAQEVQSIDGVTLVEGSSSNVADLRRALHGIRACYVNTNGFALGEKDELYWGVKIFELAAEAGVEHYVYAGLPYTYKRSGWNPKFNVGHLDGKGRVADFISAQSTKPMNWTVINSCLYLEILHTNGFRPTLAEDSQTYVFTSGVGDGSAPMITLPDLALYTKWVFEHPEEARGLILDTATEHVNWHDLAKAFTEVTGKQAVYRAVPTRAFGEVVASQMPGGLTAQFGEGGMMVADNFTAFMEVHKLAIPGNQGLWTIDYDRLDDILPGRVRSVADWMRKVGYMGEEKKGVLKTGTRS